MWRLVDLHRRQSGGQCEPLSPNRSSFSDGISNQSSWFLDSPNQLAAIMTTLPSFCVLIFLIREVRFSKLLPIHLSFPSALKPKVENGNSDYEIQSLPIWKLQMSSGVLDPRHLAQARKMRETTSLSLNTRTAIKRAPFSQVNSI